MSIGLYNFAEWISERRAAPKKSGSVIISVFSDFVVPHGGAIMLGSLLDACKLLGISEQTLRSSVNRLVDDGWIESEARGRVSIIRFTEAGLRRYSMVARRVYKNIRTEWHGHWHFVVTNPWLVDHGRYVEQVHDLLWSGFGQLSENVFFMPHHDAECHCFNWDLMESTPSSMACFKNAITYCGSGEAVSAMVARAWDMDKVNGRYGVFIERYRDLSKAIAKSPDIPGDLAFTIRSMMLHDFRRIRLTDPTLPSKLLPPKWEGERAHDIAHKIYDLVSAPSEQFIITTMHGPDGRLPRVKPWFYTRFGGLTKR